MTLDPGQEHPQYGLIVGITARGTVNVLVRTLPAWACARKLRELADELEREPVDGPTRMNLPLRDRLVDPLAAARRTLGGIR